jgi:hypothetical protein
LPKPFLFAAQISKPNESKVGLNFEEGDKINKENRFREGG